MSHKARRTEQQRLAAERLARGRETDEQIAGALNLSRFTLIRWRREPAFMAQVAAATEAIAAGIRDEGIANRQNRLDALNSDWQKTQAVIDARAAYYPEDEVPGGSTGLIVGKPVLVRVTDGTDDDPRYREVMEYRVDTALIDSRMKLGKQAAIELGQWTEKVEGVGAQAIDLTLNIGADRFGGSTRTGETRASEGDVD